MVLISSNPIADVTTNKNDGEFFVFIHAQGGWDVTLWSDPRESEGFRKERKLNWHKNPGWG